MASSQLGKRHYEVLILDISFLQVDQTDGDGSQAHVAELPTGWMTENVEVVAGWIAEAAAAPHL